ncbi:MAG: hypothetical protein V3575_00435 [Candidatus Absconditabacteria bacterium]
MGVDAKLAYKILQNTQNQIQADVWNAEGDTFKTLETAATVIKDSCKVIGFVGGIAVTGGAAGFATATTLTKTAIIVGGADLTLEVTDDASKIALGDNNKISKIVSTARVVTEPVASVLSIYSLPENMKTKFEKFNAVMVGLENFRTSAQEGKVVGIQLPVYKKPQEQKTVKVSVLTEEELDKWIEDIGLNNDDNESKEEIEKILGIEDKANEDETTIEQTPISTNSSDIDTNDEQTPIIDIPQDEIPAESRPQGGLEGTRSGAMNWTSPDGNDQSLPVTIRFLDNGKIEVIDDEEMFSEDTWTLEGNILKVHEAEGNGYYEFKLEGNKLTFIKAAGPDSDGKYSETYAGSSVDGGTYFTMVFTKN